MNHARQRRAFSIYELVIVLAIVALLAAVATPRLSSATVRYRANAAAGRVVADLSLARRQARSSSGQQMVAFDVAANRYRLPGIGDLDRRGGDYEVVLGDEPYNATLTSADFAGQAKVLFNGYGLPVGLQGSAGKVVIEVGDELRTIVLDGDTGDAAVLDVAWTPGDVVNPDDVVDGKRDLPIFSK